MEQTNELKEIWSRLSELSGFPEPYLAGRMRTYRRWSNIYSQQLIREDIRDLTGVKSVVDMETLYLFTGGIIKQSKPVVFYLIGLATHHQWTYSASHMDWSHLNSITLWKYKHNAITWISFHVLRAINGSNVTSWEGILGMSMKYWHSRDSSLLGYANESFWGRLSHIGSLSGSRIIISKKT